MAEKPKFDPSKPFELPEKPKFDPSQEFEVPTEDGGWMKLGKGAAGVFMGVSEIANPFSIPGGVERLGRGAYKYATTPKSFFESIREADKEAKIPMFTMREVAPYIRAGGEATIEKGLDLVTGQNIAQPFEEKIAEQKEAQERVQGDPIVEGAQDATEIAAGVFALANLAKTGLKATKFGKKLQKSAKAAADDTAFQVLKPSGKYGKKIAGSPRAQEIGDQLLKDKIVTAGASFKDVLGRTQKKLDEYGKVIGHFAENADAARARDSSIRGVMIDEVIEKVNNKVIPKLIESGAADTAEQLSNWMIKNLKLAGPSGEISFAQAQQIKGTLGKTKAKFNAANDSISADAFQDLYHTLNESIENGIESGLKKFGSAEDIKQFTDAKVSYRNLKDAEKFIEDTVGRMSNNRMFSLTDYIAGSAGPNLLKDAATAPEKAAAAFAASTLNKGLRSRGNQVQASFFNTIQNALSGRPEGDQAIIDVLRAINAQKGIQEKK